ncbi:MAG: helix-turn-helix domain-containing protein [Candidatus Eremiobacteraeota bacterium]|nr:helix-turn-helix domain-containing protein [Candidatus Eremiobacteraeota bacterium]
MKRDFTPIAGKYLDNQQAADYLRLSPRTLDRQRVTGQGPRFRKFGRRVIYALEDLEAWANGRIFDP